MEAGLIIGNQIIIMFIILIIGSFCYLKGIITKDGTKQLSSFALNIINPVLIFMSYQSKYDKTLVHGLLWSFLLSAISYAVTILAHLCSYKKKDSRPCGGACFVNIFKLCIHVHTPYKRHLRLRGRFVSYSVSYVLQRPYLDAWTYDNERRA